MDRYTPENLIMKYILLICFLMLYTYFLVIYVLFYPIWRGEHFEIKNIGKKIL